MTRSRTIVVVGTFALVVLIALSWILVLSPRLGKPGELREQTLAVESQTARLQAQIAKLQAIQRDLPAQIALFKEGRENFPTTAEVPATLDQIRAAAASAKVAVEALENGVPVILGADGAAATPEGDQPAEGATAPSASAGGLASMAVSVTVNGSYAQVTAFLQAIQEIPRAWLVDTVTVQGGQEDGSVTLTASGSMFIVDNGDVKLPSVDPNPAPVPAA